MKRISSKLKMSFSNIEVLGETAGWKMLADVEGDLKITIEAKTFFEEEGILLLELSVKLMRWISAIESGASIDFYYESMDYEDRPILAFFLDSKNNWRIYSVWQLFANSSRLSLQDILCATKQYIAELTTYLKYNFQLDFASFVESEMRNN